MAECLAVSRQHRTVECLHLASAVIDVILAGDPVSGGLHHVSQRAAQHGPARVPDVHRPGGIDADELDHHPPVVAVAHVSEGCPGLPNLIDLLLQPRVFQPEVDESWRRCLDRPDRLAFGDNLDQRLGQFHRIDASGPRQAKGQVGSEIAVFRVSRMFNLNLRHRLQA